VSNHTTVCRCDVVSIESSRAKELMDWVGDQLIYLDPLWICTNTTHYWFLIHWQFTTIVYNCSYAKFASNSIWSQDIVLRYGIFHSCMTLGWKLNLYTSILDDWINLLSPVWKYRMQIRRDELKSYANVVIIWLFQFKWFDNTQNMQHTHLCSLSCLLIAHHLPLTAFATLGSDAI